MADVAHDSKAVPPPAYDANANTNNNVDNTTHQHSENADINTNLEARIRNPLEGIPRAQLMRDVEIFAEQRGLNEHVAMLKKGALVAQNPTGAHLIDGDERLSEEELRVLDDEVNRKWHMPFRLFLTVALCSIGAAVQGWDQTGSNGATIFFPKFYGIGSTSTRDTILVGLINSGPYLGSAVIGCWCADPLNNYFGRRGAIWIAAHFCLWPVIGSAFCERWYQQLACRLLMGIGMGIKGCSVPVYAAENAPASIRGALVMTWQFWTAFGIMLGTAFNLAVYKVHESLNWRLMLGAPFLPAVPLVLFIYMCPESPRWLMKKNRYAEAWKAMSKLRWNDITVARDIFYISAQLEIEGQLIGDTTYVSRFIGLFTIPRVRRATTAAFTVMLAQQLCGINIIAFYSTFIFQSAGLSTFMANVGSFGFGATNWLFCFPAFWTIDTFGRRSLLLFTFPQMFWTLLAAGLCTLIPVDVGTARTALICLFVFLFAAFYSPGEGPVPFAYSAEVFPLSHRETGMAFSVATCLFWAWVLGLTLPFMISRLGDLGVFLFYAGMNIVALIMIFFLVPETKQRTLEELDYVFAVPARTFAKYQLTKTLPWFFKKVFLFQWNATKPPLYHFDNIATVKGEKGNNYGEGVVTDDENRMSQ